MKMKPDLVKSILLKIEESEDYPDEIVIDSIDGFTAKEIHYHLCLLDEAGLICGSDTSTFGNLEYAIKRMTLAGHEFLGNSRSPKAWNTAKRIAGHLSLTAFSGVLTRLASERAIELLDHLLSVVRGGS